MSGQGFVSLKSLAGKSPSTPAQVLEEIRAIYFRTTRETIHHDFAHAIELLKSLPDEEARERAAVFMEGIAEMRKEWGRTEAKGRGQRARAKGKAKDSNR